MRFHHIPCRSSIMNSGLRARNLGVKMRNEGDKEEIHKIQVKEMQEMKKNWVINNLIQNSLDRRNGQVLIAATFFQNLIASEDIKRRFFEEDRRQLLDKKKAQNYKEFVLVHDRSSSVEVVPLNPEIKRTLHHLRKNLATKIAGSCSTIE
ncbi:hypothetical protein HAX54_043718, partial [Datura stramonium]|nr:hypothetical protein [Datura stramonium]